VVRLRNGVGWLLRNCAMPLFFSVLLTAQTPQWPADAPEFKIHMIGQAHIDAVWLWPWPEGMSVVQSTFRSALERMLEAPSFAFTASSAQFYAWLAASDPRMLEEIRRRVEDGHWDPVGGWWVEPDVNLPSGEALIRQGLYGQLTFRRLLGRIAKTGYNPDSFGHPGSLPQILKLQRLDNYVFMRPSPQEKSLPADLFWWESQDGTRVLVYRIPVSYNDDKSVRQRVLHIVNEQREPVRDLMAFYGAGDHGGGATNENIRSIEELQHEPGAPQISFSSPDSYFAEIRKLNLKGLPAVRDDLQHHSVGCYTAESEMKKANRESEIALVSAEKLAAIGSLAWGVEYPKTSFDSAWKKVLFLQFHDSLAGTALPEHYETTARDGHGYALSVARSAIYEAAEKLAWQIPAQDPQSQYLVAFNLEPWPVHANLEYGLEWNTDSAGIVEDEQGDAIPHEWIPATTEVVERKRLLFQLEIPAFGYRQIRIRRGGVYAPAQVHADEHSLENEHLRVTFGADGKIEIFDKESGQNVFANGDSGASALVMNDPSDTWSHGVRAYNDQIGAFSNAQTTVIENGPLRAGVRVVSRYGDSILSIDWLLYAGARTLEARVSLDWHEHQKMLKFSFPVNVESPRATYELPYGNIVREANGDENPGQRWIDVSGMRDGVQNGLAVINDAKYGYSVLGSDLRISVVRGAAFAHHMPQVLDPKRQHLWQDQGVQTFRMLLVPHAETWREAGLPRMADEFTAPTPIIYQGIHPGKRTQSGSFLSIEPRNIIAGAIKKSETGDELILRLIETDGRPVTAVIDMRFANKKWSGNLGAYQIKTLRLNRQTGVVKEVNALEEQP
jgi:alpha-mannosidase